MASPPPNVAPQLLTTETVATTKWIKLMTHTYRSADGVVRPWDSAGRTTTATSASPDKPSVDAVEIIARGHRVSPSSSAGSPAACIMLVKQFRPPIDSLCIEFPAGLIDAGESPQDAALRELKEESGFHGVITSVSPPLSYEPGFTPSLFHFVHVDVDFEAECNRNVQAQPEEGEFIEVVWVPLSELSAYLAGAMRQPRTRVDGKVFSFAQGLLMQQNC